MERSFKSHSPQQKARKTDPAADKKEQAAEPAKPKEIGGPTGPEPTRYGDWERKGICVDF